MANLIQINKLSSSLYDFNAVIAKLDKFLNDFSPIMRINVKLPKNIDSLSADVLYAAAAEYRGYLDNATTFLLAILVVRLQIKNASRLASKLYSEELSIIYKSGKPEIKAARGYEEKEILARSYIDKKEIEAKEFWDRAYSDIEDFIGIIRLKMNSFKGALDTVLSQAGLLKISVQLKGLVLNPEQLEMLNALRQVHNKPTFSQSEGEIKL